jgi:hypothetical protein
LRHDEYLGTNDSSTYSIISWSAIPRLIEDRTEHHCWFVDRHEVILQELVEDDSFVVRVVVDEPLTEQEQQEWIARVRWPLTLPDGKLFLAAAFNSDWLRYLVEREHKAPVQVPPGDYLAEVLTYFPTGNAMEMRDLWVEGAPPGSWAERYTARLIGSDDGLGTPAGPPLGAWFRRDHPGRPFPSWAASHLQWYPENDPGHEQDWRAGAAAIRDGRLKVEPEPSNWVGVLVHLLRRDAGVELSTPKPDGWFPPDEGLRWLERCPLGLPTAVEEGRYQLDRLFPVQPRIFHLGPGDAGQSQGP